MTLVVRKLDLKKWLYTPLSDLDSDDIEADLLRDFETKENELSIFEVKDEVDAKRAVAAIVAGSYSPRDVGYVIIKLEELKEAGLDVEKEAGGTLDSDVNENHINIINLSGKGIIKLARILKSYREKELFQVLPNDELAKILLICIKKGYIVKKDIRITDKKIKEILDTID